MAIKKAHKKELKQILSVINESNKNAYKSIIPPEYFKDPILTLDGLKKEFAQMTFYTCELEGRIVGVAALKIEGKEGFIRWVHVLPKYRKRGIGTSLINYIEEEAKKHRLEALNAFYVFEKASWARKFYAKLGYKKVSKIKFPWGDFGFIYKKRLRAPTKRNLA